MFTRENVDALGYAVEKGFLSQEDAQSLLKQALEKAGFAFPQPVAEPVPPQPEAPVEQPAA